MPEQQIAAGSGDQTNQIQAALDELSLSGGGRLVLLAGVHRSGGLKLRGGVVLHLEEDAILDLAPQYDTYAANTVSVIAEDSDRACLVGQNLTNCAITGKGTIQAPDFAYATGEDPEVGTRVPAARRPRVLVLEDCASVRISGIRITGSPMWTIHLVACDHVIVEDVVIANDRRLPNTDGIVVDSCSHVTIQRVDIDTADDGVCLKTTRRGSRIGECRDVVVRDSRISSLSCALKVGTETFGDIEDVVFEDCVVAESNRALGIFSRDGGRISRVRYSRISVDCHETPDGYWGSGEAITVTLVDRSPDRPAGIVADVIFEDISGTVEGAVTLVSAVPLAVSGVTLRRLSLEQRPGRLGTALRYDMRPTPSDVALAAGARGRANAWTKDADGRVVGLVPYPGGLPGLFASGIEDLTIETVTIDRPSPLPAGWSPVPVVESR